MAGTWPVFSMRFIATSVADYMTVWECPEGYRAVLKQITAMHGAGSTGAITVRAHGYYAFYHQFLDANASVAFPTMAVIYERETFDIYLQGTNTYAMLAGFLLLDPGGRPDFANDGVAEAFEPPPWLALEPDSEQLGAG